MADMGQHGAPSLITEFENFTKFKPGDQNVTALRALLRSSRGARHWHRCVPPTLMPDGHSAGHGGSGTAT
jgi:hypothetical protein